MPFILQCLKNNKEELAQYLTKLVDETRKGDFHTDEVAIHHIVLPS